MMGCGATTQALYIHDGAPHSMWHMYDTSGNVVMVDMRRYTYHCTRLPAHVWGDGAKSTR